MTYRCIYCGEPAICFDHVIPSSQGGTDKDDNLVPSCIGCNSAKGDRPLDYFLRHDPEVFSRVQLYLKGEYDLSEMPPTGPFRTKGSAWDLGEQRATTFRLSTETHTALNVLAAQHGIPAKKIILDGIADQFARYGVTTEVK